MQGDGQIAGGKEVLLGIVSLPQSGNRVGFVGAMVNRHSCLCKLLSVMAGSWTKPLSLSLSLSLSLLDVTPSLTRTVANNAAV